MNEAFAPTIAVTLPGRRGGSPSVRGPVLAVLLGVEIAVFGMLGAPFSSYANLVDIVRFATEIGLLALALRPAFAARGVDLSLGSTMGVCAAVLGLAVKGDLGTASGVALAVAAAAGCGGINALLIATLRLPPAVITLGTYALFRGVADGLAGNLKALAGFDPWLTEVGQGRFLFDLLPWQLPIFACAALGTYVLFDGRRSKVGSPFGREQSSFRAPIVLALTYGLLGLVAGVVAVLHVARVGQARPNIGASHQLFAITAAVLGGCGLAGAGGTLAGTVLGAFVLAAFESGVRLSGKPPELAAIGAAVFLVAALMASSRDG